MNTEMKVRDHDNFMAVHDIYTRAYNAGKTDVIKVFVERIKKDIDNLRTVYIKAKLGYDCCIDKDEVDKIINKRMKEALGNED